MNHQHFMRPFLRRALTWAFAEGKRRQVRCFHATEMWGLNVSRQVHAVVAAGEDGRQNEAAAANASAL
jgi:hypothetical protein